MTRLILLPLLACSAALAADAPGRRADQEALKSYAGLVGAWRGVGQPQRSSTKGAWKESAAWAWALTPESAALELKVEGGKFLRTARLRPGAEAKAFVMEATLADDGTRTFAGKAGARDELVLTAEGDGSDGLRRITLRPLHEARFLLLLEGRDGASGAFHRLAEVGFTREGAAFAAGDSAPACIVTEGRGTIPVRYQGKTYYVCCSGCKELFDDDPAAVIAEAEARKKAKAKD